MSCMRQRGRWLSRLLVVQPYVAQDACCVVHAPADAVVLLYEVPLLEFVKQFQRLDATAVIRVQAVAASAQGVVVHEYGSLYMPQCTCPRNPAS